jgi:hypothetical protein
MVSDFIKFHTSAAWPRASGIEEWILIFEKQLDRINRIARIERPSAEGISPQANKIPSIL